MTPEVWHDDVFAFAPAPGPVGLLTPNILLACARGELERIDLATIIAAEQQAQREALATKRCDDAARR